MVYARKRQVRLEAHDGRVPGGDLRYVHSVDDGGDIASIYGRYRIREALASEEADPDFVILKKRCDLPKGRPALPDVPGRGHEEEPHHRGPRPGPNDQEKGDYPVG